MRKKLVIKQYKPHDTCEGVNVLDKSVSISRDKAIEKIMEATGCYASQAQCALDLLLED